MHTSARINRSSVSAIKEMMYLAEIEKRKGKSIVSLGVGIPHYATPEYIRDQVINSLNNDSDIGKYTFFAGHPILRQEIAKQQSLKMKMDVSEDNILVTPGSMAGLLYTMLTLVDDGDEVILLSPYFASYSEQIKFAGGKIIEIPNIEPYDKNDTFHLDLKKIEESITERTKAIIINSPNNPSGGIYQEAELRALAEILKNHKQLFIVTDEVYDYLIYDNKKYFNIATIQELWPNVVRCCSFSKKYGMTGWRAGFVHTTAYLIKQMLKIHDNAIVCTPRPSQMAAYFAITSENPENDKNANSLKENRELICKRLDNLPNLFTYTKPEGTYYVFPKFNLDMDSRTFAKKLLEEAGVVVVPGIGFGSHHDDRIRMSFGCSPSEINEAFDRIEKWHNTVTN